VTTVVSAQSKWRSVASYALGVWGGLTAWAALAQYVLPGRGHALGKLGSLHWVFVINLFPALLCALGCAVGLAVVRRTVPARISSRRVAMLLGLLFPLSLGLLRPVFALLGHGLVPGLVWCVVGSAGGGALLAAWERLEVTT
jgi:hypothetical protein